MISYKEMPWIWKPSSFGIRVNEVLEKLSSKPFNTCKEFVSEYLRRISNGKISSWKALDCLTIKPNESESTIISPGYILELSNGDLGIVSGRKNVIYYIDSYRKEVIYTGIMLPSDIDCERIYIPCFLLS